MFVEKAAPPNKCQYTVYAACEHDPHKINFIQNIAWQDEAGMDPGDKRCLFKKMEDLANESACCVTPPCNFSFYVKFPWPSTTFI